MKIGIRSDGGSNIGLGHIMRTLVMAKELSKANDVFYICRADNPLSDKYRAGIEKVKSHGFHVETIREDYLLSDIKNIKCDILITDSYDVDSRYFDETKSIFSKTVYIDDMNFCRYNVDFLINQNINGKDHKYDVASTTRLLLGPEYIMIRDEFRNTSKKEILKKPKNIMITLGGGDPFHITEKVLDYLNSLDYEFHVIIGPSFGKDNNLERYQLKNIRFYRNADMYEIMRNCDIAISGCGSTLYELAACGVPALGIVVADNQQDIASSMDKRGIIKSVGWHNKLSEGVFLKHLNELCNNYNLRKEMSEKAQTIIDGNGVYRIVKELII